MPQACYIANKSCSLKKPLLFLVCCMTAFSCAATNNIVKASLGSMAVDSGSAIVDDTGMDTGEKLAGDSSTVAMFSWVYFVLPRLAIENTIALPSKVDAKIKQADIDSTAIGQFKQSSAAINLRYYFDTQSTIASFQQFSPYFSIGYRHTVFHSEKVDSILADNGISGFSLKNRSNWNVQLGTDYELSDQWLANFALNYTALTSNARFNLDNTPANMDVDINPLVVSFGFGYRF